MKTTLRTLLVCTLSLPAAALLAPAAPPAQPGSLRALKELRQDDYASLRERAEARCREKSWALARDLYARAEALDLPADDARWVDFRLADCTWRAAAGTNQTDDTELQRSRAALEELVRGRDRAEQRDRVWLEVQESLGDYHWLRARDWSSAWPWYERAFATWSASTAIDEARPRYLDLVWRITGAHGYGDEFHSWMPDVTVAVVDGALKLARDPQETARAHYLAARVMQRTRWDLASRRRVFTELEAALAGGREAAFHDDALFALAQLHASPGRPEGDAQGNVRHVPDYVGAVALYRQLMREYAKGQSAHWDNAKRAVADITTATVGVSAGNVFLPGSKVQLALSFRNVGRVDLALFPVDLTRDVRLDDAGQSAGEWLASIELEGRERLRTWSEATEDKGDHAPVSRSVVLDGELAPGAYVVQATASGASARDLVLVGDAALLVQHVDRNALVWMTQAEDGRPVPGARVRLFARHYDGKRWIWRTHDGTTDEVGLARFALTPTHRSRQLFAAASIGVEAGTDAGSTQAFAQGWGGADLDPDEGWRLYATTDRPAYRPGETVHWKLVARRAATSGLAVPEGERLEWRVFDPQGAEVAAGDVRLNGFGSASGELTPGAAWTLGEYRVTWRKGGDNIGNAAFFRLEEYKLPEFRVSVELPDVPSAEGEAEGEGRARKQSFKSGETVSAILRAEYYFGGPVAGAEAEVLVWRETYYPRWERVRAYPWFYVDSNNDRRGRGRHWGGGPQLVSQQTLETDAAGTIAFAFPTDVDPTADYEYRIEARITDASRRQVTGNGTVRVARQRFWMNARPRHNLHRPGDEVAIDFESQDANAAPFAAEGRLSVQRMRTVEVWRDGEGRPHSGEERDARRARDGRWPEWTLAERREEHDEVLARRLTTGADGKAAFAFTPERTGTYRVLWAGADDDGVIVTAETTAWVADNATTELGVRHGALDIVLDGDTFRAGTDGAVMLTAPGPDRWVLFVQHAGEHYDARVVHMTGSVKLLTLPIDGRHVPNVFLQAWMVSDRAVWQDAEEVIVPPVEQFLELAITPGNPEARPGSEDVLTVVARDHAGAPVAAEIEVALVDEAVLAIQADYAGDPRQFFHGRKRGNRVAVQTSFEQRAYTRLRENKEGGLVDERQVRFESDWDGGSDGVRKNEGGQRAALGRGGPRPPATAKMAARDAPMESVADEALGQLQAGISGPAYDGAGEPALVVRSDFRTTALWEPAIVTGADGTARVPVRYPDSTTRWRATARAADAASRFGVAEGHARTRLPLQVRLQAPRFFVAGDRCVISALIDNNTDGVLAVRPALVADGLRRLSSPDELVRVPAGGQARVDWPVSAVEAGTARLQVSAAAAAGDDALSDAMERAIQVYEHGIDKLVAKSAKLTAAELALTLDLPTARRAGSTTLDVRVAPSMAVTMLDALPYLIDYPYGCVEQTMSRFMPAVVTARTLASLGLEPADVAGRMFGGVEPAHAGQTHANDPDHLARLDEIVAASLARLIDFQHSDGGWGWWKHGDSDPFMSAYVLWGFAQARAAGVDVPADVMQRAARFVALELVEAERRPDLQAWMLHALAVHLALADAALDEPHALVAADNLWAQRDALNAYTRSLFALAAHHLGQRERARTLIDNLRNGVALDETPDASIVQRGPGASDPAAQRTAHWGQDGIQRRWSSGSVEATAFALRALVAIDPQNDLVAPTAHWLVRNRRGAQWSNTRDTAIVVLALNDYLRASGELTADLDYELWVNGTQVARRTVRPADVLAAPSLERIAPELVRDGGNEVRLVRTRGAGALYLSAEARFFSLEEPIEPAGNELFARRQYNRLTAVPTLLSGPVIEKRAWSEGDLVPSGERIEVVLTLEAKNDLEYLVIEDLKPAGLEAVSVVSGEPLSIRELKSGALERSLAAGGRLDEARDYTGRSRSVHQELRDRKVALFVDKLPQGVWQVRYELRAEVPGEFHALPVLGQAMYVPEIRCNGREVRFRVVDP